MTQRMVGLGLSVPLLLVALVVASACAPAAPATPTPAPKAAAPTAAPAATKPAAPAPPTATAAAPTAAAAAGAASKSVVELRAGSSSPKEHVLSVSTDDFAERVKKKTNGEVNVRVFYGSLGAEQQLAQAVASGGVDMGMISNGNAARFTDAFLIYDLPFLFKEFDNVFKSLEGPVGQKALAQFEKDLGIKMLYVQSYGWGRDIYVAKKPVKVPADIKGLKIRVVSSPVDLATIKAWGANPTPVDYAQLYTALQQGTVDGEGLPLSPFHADKHYEVVKYGVRLGYQSAVEMFFINPKKFASLSPQHQQAMMEAAKEAQEWGRKNLPGYLDNAVEQMIKATGFQYYKPTPEEYAQWASIRESVWKQVAEEQKGKIDLNLAKQIYESQ